MKIENLTCIDYLKSGEAMIITVEAKTMEEVEKALIGKETLTITTDNEEAPEVVEKLLGYVKGRNIQKDLSRNVFIVTLYPESDQERELRELRERVEILERKEEATPVTLSLEDDIIVTKASKSTKTAKQVNLTN
ncbi:hypothetical protein [uncultured Parabacteroides sp.]|uniref:hypothetical protein n=1 Tax=uncultured Parabacteroides sp. TaxID=512312 RepID=UPI00259B994F|nr:hypothetical protein [uncultured Parabacteroides sp.]